MTGNIPPIKESVDELHELVLAARKQRLKTRLLALWMLKTGQVNSREEAAATLGVHRHTISRWLDKYAEGGIEELVTIRTRPNRKRVVPPEAVQALREALKTPEQFSSYQAIQQWLKDRFDLDVKYKTLYRLVRYEIGVKVGRSPVRTRANRPASGSNRRFTQPVNEPDEVVLPAVFGEVSAQLRSKADHGMGDVLCAIDALSLLLKDDDVPSGAAGSRGARAMLPGDGKRIERARREARAALRTLASDLSVGRRTVGDAADAVDRIAADLAAAYPRRVHPAPGRGGAQTRRRVPRVVLAEEDDITATVVARRLEGHGIQVERIRNATAALERVASGTTVDVFVVDGGLPHGGGLQVLKAVRASEASDTPVIILGWPEDESQEQDARAADATGYVYKPFMPRDFAGKILALLKRKGFALSNTVDMDTASSPADRPSHAPDRRADRTGGVGRSVS